jgi:hypothetical protein
MWGRSGGKSGPWEIFDLICFDLVVAWLARDLWVEE